MSPFFMSAFGGHAALLTFFFVQSTRSRGPAADVLPWRGTRPRSRPAPRVHEGTPARQARHPAARLRVRPPLRAGPRGGPPLGKNRSLGIPCSRSNIRNFLDRFFFPGRQLPANSARARCTVFLSGRWSVECPAPKHAEVGGSLMLFLRRCTRPPLRDSLPPRRPAGRPSRRAPLRCGSAYADS